LFPQTEEIKRRRLRLGVSQKKLAFAVGASQSLIAKIESKRVNPSYEVVKSIFEYFDELEKPHTGVAKDVHRTDLVWASSGDTVRKAAEIMREKGYSQLPVRGSSDDVCVGSISEKVIVQKLLNEKNPNEFYSRPVSFVMQDQFPVVDENLPLSAVASLLIHSQAVLTARRGKICGIITNSDLLRTITGNGVKKN
jgi:predicted transcriptional regulator